MKLKIVVLSNEFTQMLAEVPLFKREIFHSDFNY